MTATFPRGSEWRKWDLHLHAPGTKQADSFKPTGGGDIWEEYCRKLHDSDVQAFGIADYFSADAYFAAKEQYQKRYPDSFKPLFPNIELRTNDVVNRKQEEVNIHLLFNSFHPDHADKIRLFLSCLKTNKTDGEGRPVRANELRTAAEFGSATTTRAYIQEALLETYGRDKDLLDCVLIITAANNDGIRPERGKLRKELITDELDKLSDAFFGNSGNVQYFLSTDRAEDKSCHTQPKPVLSASDAHSFADLDAFLGQVASGANGTVREPTWIKADLTFEGLKQIIFEPRNRVFIGAEPEIVQRVRLRKTWYIESLQVNCVDGYADSQQHGAWFCDETIPLGKELVAIIGNKGSGKSAITDIIGLLGNSHNQTSRNLSGGKAEDLFSFLNKDKFLKGGCAKNFRGTLNWYGGDPDEKLLDDLIARHLPEKVEYLPQKYLERICANISDDEFRVTLNEVIFRYVKEKDRHNKTNLDELIKHLTHQSEADIVDKKQNLREANDKVVSIEKKLTADYRREVEQLLKLKREELTAHSKVCPPAKLSPEPAPEGSTDETKEIVQIGETVADIEFTIKKLEAEQVDTTRITEDIGQLKQAIEREVASLSALETQHEVTLATVGLTFNQVVKVNVDYAVLDSLLKVKSQRLDEVEALLRSKDEIIDFYSDPGAEELRDAAIAASVICQKANLEERKAEIVERLSKPAREYQEYLTQFKSWSDREVQLRGAEGDDGIQTLMGLERELNSIDAAYPQALIHARANREEISKELFRKKQGLTQFYNTVKVSIDSEIAKCRHNLGDYDISIDAGLRLDPLFFEEFARFINQGARGSFHGQQDGQAILSGIIDSVSDWENEHEVFSALASVVDALHFDRREENASKNLSRDVFKQMKGMKSVQDLYDYLFGFDYLDTKYDLKVDQKDLSELSPGERGGLLLVFYLMLDRQETPLVIDQPEDNLDNKSIYEILVTFIKEAKKRRQIILVTHNPNLAVVADAEQIIHVAIDKKNGRHDFDFFSGSIENSRINQAVVDILEGTLPAFDNRRLKYRKQRQSSSR
ncbi:TrlF family AAA-like ATPase [Anatilimnocola sp. NA78]|uniref:TrlF family AAA-like ATPase n=1 Tax=Anatilimnocola sp. NA78 TaxID=3415683 RepID=UPI003CE54E35